MKILRISYEWPPPWDGLVPAPYEMTRAQVRLGHKIDVFCGRWPKAGAIVQEKGVTLHPFVREFLPGTLNITTSVFMFLYYLKWRVIKKNKPDIIHSHGHFGIWIYAYRALLKKYFPKSKELEVPLVVHWHNTVVGRAKKLKEKGEEPKLVSKHLSWPLAEKSDRWAVAAGDEHIFVSQDLIKEAQEYYGASAEKCHLVESGVNTHLFIPVSQEEKNKTRKDLGIEPPDKVIINYGMIVARKNIHLLVESLTLLPKNYKLLLIGSVPDKDYEYKISTIIHDNNLDSRVIRVGYTEYPRIPIGVQAADVMVLPSEWEGLPKVVLESLACNVPVVASGFKAVQEIPGLIYLETISANEIAHKVMEVVNSGLKPDRGFVQRNYSWDHMARKVDDVYEIY